MKKIVALLAFVVIANISFAGANKFFAPDKSTALTLKIADKFYAESYYYTAVEYYKDVLRQDTANRYATYWLAMALLQSRDYANSEIFFRKFYILKQSGNTTKKKWDAESALYNLGDYYFGQILHRNGKYDEAIAYLNRFQKKYVPKDDNDDLKKLAKLEVEGCEFSKTAPKAKVKILNAGANINKSYNEDAPYGVGESELFYSALKTDAGAKKDTLIFVNSNKSTTVYQLMHSVKENNQWGKGKPVDNNEVNEDGYIVGNGTFNKSFTRFYFTKCLEMEDDRSLCNLFAADYKNKTFLNVARITEPVNSKEKYTATQPTVQTADDGTEIIYFVTDRPGGSGGMDIWYTTRLQNGEYKEAKPLKGPVNTPGDEATPYFDDSTKTLYFSSTGHPGLGGYDVFKSAENADLSWDDAKNLGTPINSGADDLYYTKSLDQSNGFLSSNREGSVPLNNIKTASDDIFYWTNFRYAVEGLAFKEGDTDSGSVKNAVFKLYKKLPDGSKTLVSTQNATNNTPASGNKVDGFYFFKLEPESDYLVEVDKEGFQPNFENVTTKGLPDEDTIQNNIVIHRAAFAVKGLVTEQGKKEGIKDANVELIEVYSNGMEKTVYYMKSDPYHYFDLELNKNYKIVARKEGYFTNTTNLSTVGITGNDTIRKDIELVKLEMNKAYTLQNVLYEFGKSTLTENSKNVLDNLYQIMIENPSFIIELSSHTDGVGSETGNLKLSQARAESCVNYLISKGIGKDRLVAKGYGKTKPKVPNTTEEGKDDPAGRAINRRTEFQITGLKKEQ